MERGHPCPQSAAGAQSRFALRAHAGKDARAPCDAVDSHLTSGSRFVYRWQLIKLPRRLQRPQHPVRTALAVGGKFLSGSGLRQPLLINLVRLCRIDVNVAVLVSRIGSAHADGLVPAAHSRNRIGMDREGQVLMHADVVPPDAQSVFVA